MSVGRTVALSTGAFYVIQKTAALLFSRFSPVYQQISPPKQLEWQVYAASLAHAVGVSTYCVKEFALDYKTMKATSQPNAAEQANALAERKKRAKHLLAAMLGYFLNDLIQTRAIWIKDPANLLHHAGAIAVLSTGMQIQTSLLEFTPYVVMVEMTTILLNLGWFARESGRKVLMRKIFKCFALSFLLIRVIGVSAVVGYLHVKRGKQLAELGIGKYGLDLVVLLQYYWFSKIVRMVLSK